MTRSATVQFFLFAGIKLIIKISSSGKDDPGFFTSTASITINGTDFQSYDRGMDVVVLSSEDGGLVKNGSFELVSDNQASQKLIDFIQSSPRASIILVSTSDDYSVFLTPEAKLVLTDLGVQSGVGFRNSLALVTQKDTAKPAWFREQHARQGKGPVSVEVEIFL